MKLQRVNIDGFGRYAGRTFEFGEGLNVIYGKNEAGKSTLQHFLLAMLYGQKKPGRKRTVYLEEETKYRPWQGSNYGGVLWMSIDGVLYRVERSLRRDDEWVRVYRQDTGEDVTSRFPVDSRKEVTFAQALLGADRDLFVHTLCIGPVDERERMTALQASVRRGEGAGGDMLSMPEQTQVRAAEEALQKRLDAIGTERAAAKPLGMAVKVRDEAQRAYLEALERENSQKDARHSAEQASQGREESVRDELRLREELTRKLALYLNRQEAKRVDLLARMELLQKALDDNEQAMPLELDEAGFRELQQDFTRLVTAKREWESYQKRLETVTEESREPIAFAARYKTIEDNGLAEVERVARELELIEQSPHLALQERDPNEHAEMEKGYKGKRRTMWIMGALALLALPFCFTEWLAVFAVLLFLGAAVFQYFSAIKIAGEMEAWDEQTNTEIALKEAAKAQQARLEVSLLDLLVRFDVDTPRKYRQKWTQLVKAREQAAAAERQSSWLAGEVSRAKSDRDILARRILRKIGGEESQAATLNTELLREEIAKWEKSFEESRLLKEQRLVWQRELDGLRHESQAVEQDLTRWQQVADTLQVPLMSQSAEQEDASVADIERLYQSWQMAERILFEKNTSFTEASTRYKTLQEGQKSPADLLLEKQQADADLQEITEERDALLLAQEVWGEVKEEMYQAIAPRFTTELADVTARVTQGRYQDVYVDRDETVSTISPDSGYTVQLSALSEGTIDQITFALGLAVSGWTIPGGENLPLLLDEPFRRYDDARLQSVLDVLLEEAEKRQILLFTCREQEVERLLEQGGERVRVLELSEEKYGMIKVD